MRHHKPALLALLFVVILGCFRLAPAKAPEIISQEATPSGEVVANIAAESPGSEAEGAPAAVVSDRLSADLPASADPPARGAADLDFAVRAAIARSLPFIEAEGLAWMRGEVSVQDGAGCVSCHHVNYAVWGLHEARRIGLEAPGGDIDHLTAAAIEFAARPDKARSMMIGPMLLGLSDPDPRLTERLIDLQTSNGRWRARGQFPDQRRPVMEADAVATMWSLLVLPKEELADSGVARSALDWLLGAPAGETVEWQVAKLLLADALGRSSELAEARAAILDRQNEDGGWGWLPGEVSNAFSTGQVLYAFSRIGDEANAGGQRFLVESQDEAGLWHVPSSALSSEPTADRDLIYRYWGTAWAAIGLSRSLST